MEQEDLNKEPNRLQEPMVESIMRDNQLQILTVWDN